MDQVRRAIFRRMNGKKMRWLCWGDDVERDGKMLDGEPVKVSTILNHMLGVCCME